MHIAINRRHFSGVDEAKLWACLAGLFIGISLNLPIILETDSVFVSSFLAPNTIRLMRKFKLSRINRNANQVAHEIAKFGLIIDQMVFFLIVSHPARCLL